ncbi:hypothetical protein BH11MYX1_BH11MYX1_18780 [soil metagenome]
MESGSNYSERLDVAAEALIALSSRGGILAWNHGAEVMYGYTAIEAIGHDLASLTVPELELVGYLAQLATVATGESIAVRTMRHTKQGLELHIALVMQLVPGEPPYIAVRELDVTQVVTLDGLETTLEEVRRLKTDFLANMSHELRTPLNSIIGFAELMYKGKVGPVAPEHLEFLGDIVTSSRRLLQLVNDVLDLAKLESGKLEFHPARIDLEHLASEVRDIVKGLLAEKQLKFELAIDDSCRIVMVDPMRIKQVLYTFLSNAVKFTPRGGRIVVRARPGAAPSEFRLEVEDSGMGIAPENLPNLFVEFPRIGVTAQREGTGLGLALAQRIIEGHGGRVEVTSTVGLGSTFSAILPRRTEARGG